MANEISARVRLTASKNGAIVACDETITFDMAGNETLDATQLIGTAAEALTFGEMANAGTLAVKNLDATNYVELSMASDATNPFAKLKPGRWCLVPASAATYYAKANTAACRIRKVAVEL